MTPRLVRAWARRRTEAEWLALAVAVATFGYVGWDSALWDANLQLLLHLFAIGAIGAVVVHGLRGGELPRTRIDVPLLALLAAFAVATASALNVGMSLRAMGAIIATAAMLPVALIALRHRPSWVGAVTSVPVLLLSVPTLLVLLGRRVEWIVAGAPGLPPLRLAAEGTPFGSVAVPPFVIWPAWALAGLIEHDGLRRTTRTGLVVVGLPMTILSGSRSAWLGIAAVVALAAVPWAWRHRSRLRLGSAPGPRQLATLAIGALVVLGVAALVVPRITAVTSLLYRVALWRDTLHAWSTDPLFGIGPGFMPYARQAAAPDFTFPVRQPHSHNLPLGVLGDAGLVGLAAGLVLVAVIAWVANPWRMRSRTGRTAAFVLIGLGVAGLFEDITFLPNFNLLVIGLLAVALADGGAVEWVRFHPRPLLRRAVLAAGAVGGAMLLAAMVTADAGAIAFRGGTEATADGDVAHAAERFSRAVAIDPWHPGGPKALTVAADAAGDASTALAAARMAVERNPGDGPSWTNLAVLCAAAGDRACQLEATERAGARASFLRAELANAAVSYESLGMTAEADDAYRRSLLSQRLTAFGLDWPRRVRIGAGEIEDQAGGLAELNRLLAWWDVGEPIDPTALTDPATRALAHAMRGERSDAEAWLARAIATRREDLPTWDIVIVLRDAWGLPVDRELRIAEVARGGPFPPRVAPAVSPSLTYDIGSFRAYPGDGLVRDAVRLIVTDPAYPWVLAETLP